MSNTPNTTCFVEQNDFSLLVARVTSAGRSPRVDACQEITLSSPNILAAGASVLTAGATIVCGLRPKIRRLHLATSAEASAHSGIAGTHAFARAQPALVGHAPGWSAATRARDGAAPNNTPWFLALTANESRTQALAQLEALRIKPTRIVSATHHLVGAIASSAHAPTLVLEFGELSSHLLLISSEGLLAVAPTSLNLDRVAEAVQAELGMKFRGSAVKLLFSPDYDFTEAGPKIAARLAAALKPELAALRSATPTAFLLTGLPATQNWLAAQLSAALGIAPFAPKLKSWGTTGGLTFANPELEAALSPVWMGFLHLIAAATREPAGAWQSEWIEVEATATSATVPSAVVPIKKPAPLAPAEPDLPAVKSAVKFATPTPAEKPAAVESAAKSATRTSSVHYTAKSTAAPNSAKKHSEPAPAKSVVAVAMSKAAATPPRKFEPTPAVTSVSVSMAKPSFSKRPAALTGAAVALLLAVGGFFYAQAQRQDAVRVAVEKTRAEALLQAESERARLAEQTARAELAARKKFETEAALKIAAAEAARQLAENETRAQVAARVANARGTLVVREPVGSIVTVGSLPPRTAPATFDDIKIGRYSVTVALPLHAPANLELEVRENATTETGPLKLERLVGTLALSSEPAGVSYSVRPSGNFFTAPGAIRSGHTPATLSDLSPGEYVISFSREGWPVHDETVHIGRDTTVNSSWAFRTGVVKVDSTPAGATVTRKGATLGITPLTLSEQNPGEVVYELSFPGYDSEQIGGRIEPGQVLSLTQTLADENRISRLTDTDERPIPIVTPQPEIGSRRLEQASHIDIQLVVDRYGNTRDLSIAKSDNPEIAKLCLAAATKWKFKPATIKGKPVNVRVAVPFNILPSQ
ncbi:MAG: PEGA domain-containing protein [Opitutaceae bacterium]